MKAIEQKKRAITEVDIYGLFKEVRKVTVNFWDPGAGNGTGNATIVDPSTNRVDNSNIGRRVIYTKTIEHSNHPILEFDIYSKIGENYELPLDINGTVTSFKKIDGMIQLPLFENDKVDPNKIRKFRLDLSQLASTEIDIECEMLRFDYYFNDISNFHDTKSVIITENNNNLINKTFGFGDGVIGYDLDYAFKRKPITSTPKMIVARNVISFADCFQYCSSLITVSQKLFDNCPKVTSFQACFGECSLTIIPQGLFDNCINAISFHSCFSDCHSLTIIPQGLFDNCVSATEFGYCFSWCESLTIIPERLFYNCPKVTGFGACFISCISLTTIPTGLFDKNVNVIRFDECFSYCSNITSKLPDAWNKSKFPNVTDGKKYAYNCTKAANYNEIPANFK